MSIFRGELVRHPGSPTGPVERIAVVIERTAMTAKITYEVVGDTAEIALPERGPRERRDALWTETCFELFVRHVDEGSYFEWNFAPSTAWAAYRFDAYRANMHNADVEPPAITTDTARGRFRMHVAATIDEGALSAGLSAVIRHADGSTSYWALAHPPGKADFHHPDCFVAELAPSMEA